MLIRKIILSLVIPGIAFGTLSGCTREERAMVTGAVVGGVAGGVIGHNNGRHAAGGAAIGVLAGALTGLVFSEITREQTRSESQTAKVYGHKDQPFARVESVELRPAAVKAGEPFNFKITAALLGTGLRTEVIEERILMLGDQIIMQEARAHMWNPGTWTSEMAVTLPADIKPGFYTAIGKIKTVDQESLAMQTLEVRAK